MRSLLRRLYASKTFPVVWTLLTIALLCIPGSSLPGEGIEVFEIPQLDKIVHVLLFGGIVMLWGAHYGNKMPVFANWKSRVIILAILSSLLGIVLEYVQLYCIPQRSFDVFDILADTGGAVIAAILLTSFYPRNKFEH